MRASERATASFFSLPSREFLADAEDEEQPVVGPGTEHEHDEQELREHRDL